MRFKNAMMNSFMIMFTQVILIFVSLTTRKVFIATLGISYLGFDGLFANIIGVLSIADLGLVQAMYFSLYKPIHDEDYDKVNRLINFYKKIFYFIGFCLIIISFFIVPFLGYFITSDVLSNELRIIFVLFSLSSFSSYFFVTKRALFFVSQKNYVTAFVDFLAKFIMKILQIICLVKYQSYIFYIVIDFSSMFISNLIITRKANKTFNYVKKDDSKLEQSEKNEIVKNVKNVFFSKLCGVGVGCTDSLIISKFLGVASLGIVSNYTIILSTMAGLFSNVYNSVVASFAHLYNDNSVEHTYANFILTSELMNIIAFILVVGASAVIGDFIPLFFGLKITVGTPVLIVLILNSYLVLATFPITSQVAVVGKFKQNIPVSLAWAISNLVISLVLAPVLGLFGVYFGTFASYIIWFLSTAFILRKDILNNKYCAYLVLNLKYFVFCIASVFLFTSPLFNTSSNLFFNMITKGFIAVVYIGIFLGLLIYKRKEFKMISIKMLNLLKRKKKNQAV